MQKIKKKMADGIQVQQKQQAVVERFIFVILYIIRYSFRIIHYELGIQCRFYDLRSGFATISLRNGCEIKDVAEVLGHKRIETTQKYYILSLEENKKKVTEVFEDEVNKI